MRNFCSTKPKMPPSIEKTGRHYGRDTMTQPNCYWTLDTPFVTIIGLYTNVPSGGDIRAPQVDWFTQELAAAPKDKPLIVAMHHPAHSIALGSHAGSKHMDQFLLDACGHAKRVPELVLCGHVHNYQRFETTWGLGRCAGTGTVPASMHSAPRPRRARAIASDPDSSSDLNRLSEESPMYAVAISNNDMVYLYWHIEDKIPKCLGFNVVRHDATAKTKPGQPLPAMVGFPTNGAAPRFQTTKDWPVQKYAWKDVYAARGGSYWYEIVPMVGTPDSLEPHDTIVLRTNTVSLAPERAGCSVYFNRGIISTQAIARNLPKGKGGAPSSEALRKLIANPNDKKVRPRLKGDIDQGLLALIERAKKGGACYGALYELSDQELIDGLESLKKKLHLILSNAGSGEEDDSQGDSTNKVARSDLHERGLDVDDRMLVKGHIGHNKFLVFVDAKGPQAVLTGSTNWTPSGLCAQSNNAILIESPGLAADYLAYWKTLKDDTEAADGDSKALQGADFRSSNKTERPTHDLNSGNGQAAGDIHVWFSPNTRQKSVPRRKAKDGTAIDPPTPPDLKEVFQLINDAKQGVLFLAFIPGNPSIVTELKRVYDAKRKKKELFYIRGAATSPDPAGVFQVKLFHRSPRSDATVRAVNKSPSAGVASVAGVFQAFAQWESELYKLGHAVIHDKIVVIDPFSPDSVVITGSHNLGYRASYNNDENMVIIRNNRSVAEAYAAHVLDVYEHYRWRWRIQQPLRDAFDKAKAANPNAKAAHLWHQVVEEIGEETIEKAWHQLEPSDAWQDYYQTHKDLLAAEVNFWSPFGGIGKADEG